MLWPKKGAEFGLYKPKPKIVLVYQVDAKVLLECLKKYPKRPLYIVDTCLLPEYIIVGLSSGLFSPFVVSLVFWIFVRTYIHLYIFDCGQSFWHCK